MKEFIFISDFDGTITEKDFYWILLDDYIGEQGIAFYHEWKKEKKIGTEFLNKVFTWYRFSDEERLEALNKVSIDPQLKDVIEVVKSRGGDFIVLSAGFRYYIDYVLSKNELNDIEVITNEGGFYNETFLMEPDEKSPYYSEVYGVNKETVALNYKKKYKKVYFAGDSEPDFWAAKHADVIFAKNELARILEKEGIKYHSYESFADILKAMKRLI